MKNLRETLKKASALIMAGALLASNVVTAEAASGQWKQNATGWWWEWGSNSYPVNTWRWIDGNNDGKAECYYFGADGYMLANTTTPDGYTVNADGAWTVDGVVQTQGTNSDLHDVGAVNVAGADAVSGAVTDGKALPKMVFDETLFKAYHKDCIGLLSDKVPSAPGYPGQDADAPTYAIQRNGKTITLSASSVVNRAGDYFGPVSAFFSNFPEQGIELNAFYDNTGYESFSAGRQPMGSTGDSDSVFGLPQGSYRMGWGSVGNKNDYLKFHILLTKGEDGKWYIYPDSPMSVN